MSTKEELRELFKAWQETINLRCTCYNHWDLTSLCERELAWRAYTKARDIYLAEENIKAKITLDELLAGFDS